MAVHRSERNGVSTPRRCLPAPSCSLPWRRGVLWNCPANLLGYWLYDTFWLAQRPKFLLWPRPFSSARTQRVRIIAGARIDASFPFSPLRDFGDRLSMPIPRLSAHPSPQPCRDRIVNAPERSEADRARRNRAGLTVRNRAWHLDPAPTRPLAALQRVPWSVGLPLSDGNFALENRARNEVRNEARFATRNEVRNGARRWSTDAIIPRPT